MAKIKKIKKTTNPVTKEILKKELEVTRKELRGEIITAKLGLEERMNEMDKKNKGYRDQVLTGLDGVMKELETIREENAAGTLLIERISDRLDDHEERISNLESPVQ